MRVFISSVMNGFEVQRAVARAAVESLGMRPVMAEDFGARPHSSREACLEGVRESDCYLGVFDDRYGWLAPSGVSVTHEEFYEARGLGIPILLIVKDPAPNREPELAAFLKETGEYESGYFHGKYHTEADLATAITRALTTISRGASNVLSAGAAGKKLTAFFTAGRGRSTEPSVCLAVMPADRTAALDVRLLSGAPFRGKLSQAARYDVPLFREDLGIDIEDGAEFVALLQTEDHRSSVNRVEVHVDRTMAVTLSLEGTGNRDQHAWLEQMILSETLVSELLAASLKFIAYVQSTLLPVPPPPRLYVQAALLSVSGKLFGHPPSQPLQSLSMSGRNDGTIVVPSTPMLVPQGKVAEAQDLADQLREHFGRRFKADNAYFVAPSRHR